MTSTLLSAPMRRAPHQLACRLLLATVALLASPAFAADDIATRAKAQQRSFDILTIRLRQADVEARPDVLKTQHTLSWVREVSDRARLLDEVTYGPADMPQLQAICMNATRLQEALMMFGVKTTPQAGLRGRMLKQIPLNIKDFDPHMVMLMPFMMRCGATMMVVAEQIAAEADRRGEPAGIDAKAGRRTVLQAYGGAIQMLENLPAGSGLGQPLASSLAESASIYAGVLPLPERHALAARLREAGGRVPGDLQAYMQQAATAFESTECARLCSR